MDKYGLTYIDGFDPAGPLEYAPSEFFFWTVGGPFIALIIGVIVWLAIFMCDAGDRRALVIGGITFVLGAGIFIAFGVHTPKYDAAAAAAEWAQERYGVDLEPDDAKALLSRFECDDNTRGNKVCTNEILDQRGRTVTAKFVNDKVILIEPTSHSSELAVTYDKTAS